MLLTFGAGNAWGEETATLSSISSKNVVTSKGQSVSTSFGNVTCKVTKNSGNEPGFYTKEGIVRYYENDVMTLSVPAGNTITKIVFTMYSGTPGTANPTGLSLNTWSGSSESVSFTGGVTVKISKIVVTYKTASAPKEKYTLTYQAGSTTGVLEVEEGTNLLAALDGIIPVACDLTSTEPIGWSENEITKKQANEPALLNDERVMPSNDHNVYYVFAKKEEIAGGGNTTVIDKLTRATTGVTGTSYSTWSGKTVTSNAVYAGQSAGGNESIQLRSDKSTSGIITTASGGKVKKITIVWNSNTSSERAVDVYGKNSAYSGAADLYNASAQGTKLGSIKNGSSVLTISGDYTYIGLRSSSGALYLTSVSIEWETHGGGSITISDYTTECSTDATYSVQQGTIENCTVKFSKTEKDFTNDELTGLAKDDYVHFTITPTTGYELKGEPSIKDASNQTIECVGVDGVWMFQMPASDVTVSVSCVQTAQTYSVTYDLNGATGTTPTEEPKAAGDKFKLAASTGFSQTGYRFMGWDDGTDTYEAGAQYTMPAANVTLTAQWEKEYKVIYDANGGSTTCAGGTYIEGEQVEVCTVVPNKEGHTFVDWTYSPNVTITNGVFIMPASDVTVTANYSELPDATLKLSINGVLTDFEGNYKVGEKVTLPIKSEIEYDCSKELVGWDTDKDCAEKPDYEPGATYTLVDEENMLYAVFATPGTTDVMEPEKKDYTFSDYTAGVQYAQNEEHKLDDVLTLYTTECHFTTELRIYSSSTHNGYVESNKLPGKIVSMGFNAGNNADYLVIYGSTDGTTWTQVGKVSITSTSYKDYTLDFVDTNYTYFKLDVEGGNQIRLKSITITYLPGGVGNPDYSTTCEEENNEVKVTAVTLSPNQLALEVGDTETLTATITPSNATNQTITWTSSDVSVATVENGIVKALAVGETTITVTTEDGGFTATCDISVTEPVVQDGVYYELTDLADIQPTDVVLFVGKVGNTYYAMSNDGLGVKGQPLPVEVTAVSNKIITTQAENVQWSISKLNDNIETITFYSVAKGEWLYCIADNNGLRIGTVAQASESNTFKIADNGYLYNNFQERTIGVYNNEDWRSYTGVNNNIKDQTFGFYVKHSANPLISVTPKTHNFGLVEVNKSASITLTIIPEHVTELKASITDNTNYSISTITDAADGNKQITVTYNPKDEGLHSAFLTIESIDVNERASFEVALLGQGVISDGAVWTLVKGENDLQVGDQLVIAAEYNYALSTTQDKNNRDATAIVRNNENIIVHPEVQIITLEAGIAENSWAFNVGSGYLYADGTEENLLKTKAEKDAYGSWTISITETDGVASIMGQGGNTRKTLRFNKNNTLFSCYGYNNDEKSVAIYKKQVYTRTVTPGNFGTICLPYGSSNYSGATFYEIVGKQTGKVLLGSVATLEAGMPYIFYVEDGATKISVTYEGTEEPNAQNKNGLYGTYTDNTSVQSGYYIISKGKELAECGTGCYVNANRAYVVMQEISDDTSTHMPGRRYIGMDVQGENQATELENIVAPEGQILKVIINGQLIIIRNGEKYNVQGQKL